MHVAGKFPAPSSIVNRGVKKLLLPLLALLALLQSPSPVLAQASATARYVHNYTGTNVMVHMPAASTGYHFRMVSASVSCAADCVLTQRTRTAEATGGAVGTKVRLTLKNIPDQAVVTEGASNPTTGSVVYAFTITAGGRETLDLKSIENSAGAGFSLVASSTAVFSIVFEEFQ